MTDTEKLELVKDLCVFWNHEYHSNSDIRWTSIVWAQVLIDMVSPIVGAKLGDGYFITMRQKSLQIMRRKEPALFNKIKPFLHMENKQ
jgi:hypothetical protein